MVSPYVQRNLDNAQFAQPRGSQYEGPDLGQHPEPPYMTTLGELREMQDESIHREEVAFMRLKHAHYDHYVLQATLINDCAYCMDLVG